MIENDEQLQQAYEALGDLYHALASDRAKILPVNPRNYAVIAQGPLEEIRKLQAEIDSYLGLKEPLGTAGDSPASRHAHVVRETPPAFGQGNKPTQKRWLGIFDYRDIKIEVDPKEQNLITVQ